MLPGSPPLTAQLRNTLAASVHDALLPDFSLTASWLSAEAQTEQGYAALQHNMSAALIQLSPNNPLMGTNPLNETLQLKSPYQLVQVRDVVGLMSGSFQSTAGDVCLLLAGGCAGDAASAIKGAGGDVTTD